MQIQYYTKNVYGIEKRYVKDEKQAIAISTLTGEKTLTDRAIQGLLALGFELIGTDIKGDIIK